MALILTVHAVKSSCFNHLISQSEMLKKASLPGCAKWKIRVAFRYISKMLSSLLELLLKTRCLTLCGAYNAVLKTSGATCPKQGEWQITQFPFQLLNHRIIILIHSNCGILISVVTQKILIFNKKLAWYSLYVYKSRIICLLQMGYLNWKTPYTYNVYEELSPSSLNQYCLASFPHRTAVMQKHLRPRWENNELLNFNNP